LIRPLSIEGKRAGPARFPFLRGLSAPTLPAFHRGAATAGGLLDPSGGLGASSSRIGLHTGARMDATTIARDQLKAIVERIERLEEEKQALASDIKDVYAEAKANGFDTKTLRTVVRLRKQDAAERQEQGALLDLYLNALGMIPA
jgi:uncharacterized protein (UPF0335 family)